MELDLTIPTNLVIHNKYQAVLLSDQAIDHRDAMAPSFLNASGSLCTSDIRHSIRHNKRQIIIIQNGDLLLNDKNAAINRIQLDIDRFDNDPPCCIRHSRDRIVI